MKVLILGLGQYEKGSGISAALFYARAGADVLATDLRSETEIAANVARLKKFKNVRFRLGEHRLEDIRWADVVVRNPRVRADSKEMRLASKLGKKIESDISLFMRRCPCPVVGVTGTRGKSTTSTLAAKMLKASGFRVWLGGNILVSPLTFLSKVRRSDIVVLELSSWQLEATGDAGISPHVACITNLMRDHLNSYQGMEDYGEAKAQIFRHQKPDDALIVNDDDAFCRSKIHEAPGRIQLFAGSRRKNIDAWIGKDALIMRFGARNAELVRLDRLHVSGSHNHLNMLAAALTARSAGGSLSGIRSSLKAFRGLPDRQEVVARKHGITFINDTTATTPDGTIAALRTLAPNYKTLHLILGGSDKELEFAGLAKELKGMNVDIAMLPGTAHAKLGGALTKARVAYDDVDSLAEAFKLLTLRSAKGDAVVLSPGCASFGLFANEFDRGAQFRRMALDAT